MTKYWNNCEFCNDIPKECSFCNDRMYTPEEVLQLRWEKRQIKSNKTIFKPLNFFN